jgi:hypothetical protein
MQDHNESVPPSETVDQKSVSVREAVAKQFRPTIPLLILPTLHLILCFAVAFSINTVEGGWKWFFVIVVDFPFSLLIGQLASPDPLAAFAVFGTLWWYLISVFLRWIFGVGASIANR